jgi:hypothetical protein
MSRSSEISSLIASPEVGSTLTKIRGGRLKRPGGRAFMPLAAFTDGRMKPVEWRDV